jgi:hypothetical protein
MASPVADAYSAPSGAAVYAGRYPGSSTLAGGATLADVSAAGGMSGIPAWLAALSLNTWTQIGANTIQDVNPAQDASINPSGGGTNTAPWTPTGNLTDVFNEWSGAALDDVNGRMWAGGGGHAGYRGNEYYSIDLDAGSPVWSRRGYPSGSIQKPNAGGFSADGANSSLLPDGRPHSVHNYNLLAAPPTGDLWLMARGFQWAGNATPYGYRFDGATNDWDTANPIAGVGASATGSCCYDPVRDCLWYFSGSVIGKVNLSTYAVTASGPSSSGSVVGYYTRMIYDTTRNLVVIFLGDFPGGSWSGASVVFFDPANPTTLYAAPQSVAQFLVGSIGIAYDKAGDRYLMWNGGGSVTVITPPATSPDVNTWVHSTLTFSGTPSTKSSNGTWGRFQISDKYKCLFLLNASTEKLWAVKLH